MSNFIQELITNEVFIMIALLFAVFGLVELGKKLKLKYDISSEDISFVINGVVVGDKLLRRAGVLKDENSKEVTRMIIDALAFVQTLENETDEEKVESAICYYKELASELNIVVDADDEVLIRIAFKKILLKK